jgi:anti-sigma regulatory factor (Ser/Thr protein kinase)
VSSTVGTWTGVKFAHEAFVFDSDDEVRARVVPFVDEGLRRDESVVVVAGDHVRNLLAEELGGRTAELTVFAPAETYWHGGHQTLATYRESMEPLLAAQRPWRLVGEPIWLATPGGDAWSRFEAVANDAFAEFPYYSLCLHDRRRLAPALVEAQLRVHPMMWDGDRPALSAHYESTDAYLARVEPARSARPADARTVRIDQVERARPVLEEWLDTSTITSRTGEALLAVYELVTNALRVSGEAWVDEWVEGDTVLWQVRDRGPGLHDLAAGYAPPSLDLSSGRGLWLARSLADDSSVRASASGTAVLLLFRADEAS